MKKVRLPSLSFRVILLTVAVLIAQLSLGVSVSAAAASDAFSATQETREIPVTWSIGYVGSAGNRLGNENCLGPVGGSSSYRHTNVVTIAKAGTEITFTEKGNGDSGYCSYTGYYLSSWKLENGQWVLDTEGANYQGSVTGKSEGHAVRRGNTMTYTYVTSKDNEHLRFSYCATNDKVGETDNHPKIYARLTNAKGTYASDIEKDNFPFSFEYNEVSADGALYSGYIKNVNWQDGYVGSENNKDFYVNEIFPFAKGYRYTSVIKVPYSGTTITFTDPDEGYAGDDVYFVSQWSEISDGIWICDGTGFALTGASTEGIEDLGASRKYTYTTTSDNECIRLCYKYSDATLALPTVTWSSSNEAYSTETEPPVTDSEPSDTPSDDTPSPEPSAPKDPIDLDKIIRISFIAFTLAGFLAAIVILPCVFGDKNSSGNSDNGKKP